MTTQSPIQAFGSDARGAEYKFLPAVLYAVEQFDKGNYVGLYALVALVQGKEYHGIKSLDADGEIVPLTTFKTPLKRCLDILLSNVKLTFKDGKCKAKVGDNGGVNHDKVEALKAVLELHNNRLTVRGDIFKEMFPVRKAEVPMELTQEKIKSKLDKYLEKLAKDTGLSVENLIALAQAKASDIEPSH